MKIGIDSSTLPPATRLDTWRGMLCDTYVGIDCRMPETFRSLIEGHAVGGHTFTRIRSSGHTVDRSPTLIKRDGLELVFFGIPLAGRAITIQGGREAVLEPGSVVVSDSSRPFLTHVEESAEIIWLSVPKQPVAERLRGIEDLVAMTFRPITPIRQIAVDFMAGIEELLAGDVPARDAGRLTTQVLDLLAMTIMSDETWPETSTHLVPRWPLH